jgi:hypothetical protein
MFLKYISEACLRYAIAIDTYCFHITIKCIEKIAKQVLKMRGDNQL